MHELSLCRSIVSIVDRNRRGRPVTRVGVRVGVLRQVVPETLRYCWGIVIQATELADSELVFESMPLVVRCRVCGVETELSELRLWCPACDARDVDIVQGEEFMVTFLDLGEVPGVG